MQRDLLAAAKREFAAQVSWLPLRVGVLAPPNPAVEHGLGSPLL
jgi:hypothetical protein